MMPLRLCDVEGVECSPTEKKKDAKRMKKESIYSNWKDESQDLLEVIGGAYGGVAGVILVKKLVAGDDDADDGDAGMS